MSQTANTLRDTSNRNFLITMQPGQEVKLSAGGSYFMIKEYIGADGNDFQAAFEDTPFFDVNLGLNFPCSPGDRFSFLRFKNPLDEAITVEIYVGTILVGDQRLSIARGRAARVMKAETVSTVHSVTIAAGNEVDLTDEVTFPPPNGRYVRAATIVTNMDPAVDIDLADENDDILVSVLFRQIVNWESSEAVKVQNPSAGPVVTRIAQLWYVNN